MKLSEMRAQKGKSGEYYGIDEILGEEIAIIEDVNQSTDFRMADTKNADVKYMCIRIRFQAEKDLHLTRAAMIALSEAMPQNPTESWQGYRVRINRTGSGFNIAYKIVVVGKTLEAPPNLIQDSAGKLLGILQHAPAGMEDKAFWDAAIVSAGGLPEAMCLVEKLKNEGKVCYLGQVWRAT